jgi:pseudaminic acid cytidylyltransferase
MSIAVIPARSGSKRIPGKNTKPFGNRPMIAYAIDGAIESGLFSHIVVSTDDPAIAQLAISLGAQAPFLRPSSLSDDYTSTVHVVAHAIVECDLAGWKFDRVCCIYPAVPFMEAEDLKGALALLESSGLEYSFPVTAFPSPPQRAFSRQTSGRLVSLMPEYSATRTQDLEEGYFDCGQFYWGRKKAWQEMKNIHQHGAGYVIPSWRVVDIDTNEDWRRAEIIMAFLNGRDNE